MRVHFAACVLVCGVPVSVKGSQVAMIDFKGRPAPKRDYVDVILLKLKHDCCIQDKRMKVYSCSFGNTSWIPAYVGYVSVTAYF